MKLASIFSDGAVLQQQMAVPVWGSAEPGALLRGEVAGRECYCRAARDGAFKLYLPPLEYGGPYELKVEDLDHGESVVVRDVLIGEVWLASGQSNMEYTLGTNWAVSTPEEGSIPVNTAQKLEFQKLVGDCDRLRFISLTKDATGAREASMRNTWQDVTPENCPDISAAAAWFGQNLRRELDVPIGLVINAWGGTIAEAWTSRQALLTNPETRPLVEEYDVMRRQKDTWCRDPEAAREKFLSEQLKDDPGNKGVEWGWADPELDDSDWTTMEIPGSWIRQKLSGNGAVWIRKAVDVPPELAGRELVLHLGGIDKLDITYFNGMEIGRTGKGFETRYWNIKREYRIPAGCVKAGRNVIAVRAYSFIFDGSINGQAEDFRLSLPDGSWSVMIASPWQFKAELDLGVLQVACQELIWGPGTANTPAMLFDSMLAPLFPYAVRGIIWYQGESNAHTAEEADTYRRKLDIMIQDWRYNWERPDLPFIQVELANFRVRRSLEPEAAWPVLREHQHEVMKDLENVHMATAIDIGDPEDIHPQNKKAVGQRLAAVALRHVYHQEQRLAEGPGFAGCTFGSDGSVCLSFANAQGMILRGKPGESFFLAGKDRCFHPAETAEIIGDRIILSTPAVKYPAAVRYAWADNPYSILYNAAGLPASPFRTDDWNRESVSVKL